MSVHPSVDAAPFAAHLRHVSAASGLPWAVLARAARVPLPWAEALLAGQLATAPRDVAARLLALQPGMAAEWAQQWVPARPTAGRLLSLLRSGWPPLALARYARLSRAELEAILRGTQRVTRLVDLTVAALEASHRHRSTTAAA